MANEPFRIGIDAGGTKSLLTVETIGTKERTVFAGGPLNICSISEEEAGRNLTILLNQVKSSCGELCEGIGIGAAGISNPRTEVFYRQILKKVFPDAGAAVGSDARAALLGAHQGRDGMILIAGTGSVCYGERSGKSWMAGGGGHILDDVGSGYWIGREILSAVLYEQDHRIEHTVLSDLLMERGIRSREDLISFVYSENTGKKEIAGLSTLIIPACDAGDAAALSILRKASEDLLCMVSAVVKNLYPGEPADLALAGSVLTKNQYLKNEFSALLGKTLPHVTVKEAAEDASCGALYMIENKC